MVTIEHKKCVLCGYNITTGPEVAMERGEWAHPYCWELSYSPEYRSVDSLNGLIHTKVSGDYDARQFLISWMTQGLSLATQRQLIDQFNTHMKTLWDARRQALKRDYEETVAPSKVVTVTPR